MSRPRGVVWIALVLMAVVPMAWGRAVSAQTPTATSESGQSGQLTPVLQSVLSPPRWFEGSDGRVHLVYELLLTNASPVEVTVTGLDVLDAKLGTPIATIEGDDLSAAMSLLTSPDAATTALLPATIGVIWLDIPLASPDELPAAIKHRLTITVPPGLPVPESITSTGAPAEVDLRPPVVLGPPLVGPRWVALGSCCDGPHRRAFQPLDGGLYLSQRFAIDFNVLDADGYLGRGDPSLNESYPSFGQPVIAVADAVVVAAVDLYTDQIPNDPKDITLENADGNHVVLDLGDGRFAFYAHLKSGSVAVEVGDEVRRGQQIAELGNTGSSTGPHLHVHVMDAPSPLRADGLPYVFDQFELEGRTPPLAEVIDLAEAQEPIPVDPADAGPRHDELPLGRDVMEFAAAPAGD